MDLAEASLAMLARHPWEIARAACILGLIGRSDAPAVADVGAGDLYFAGKLRQEHPGRLTAIDSRYGDAVEADGIALQNSLSGLGDASLDLVFLLDVLEHQEDDRRLLEEVLGKIKPGGRLVVTVPGHPFLFGGHDRALGHYRRYRRRELEGLLRSLGTDLTESFGFFTSLFLLRCLCRLVPSWDPCRGACDVAAWRLPEDHVVTRCLVTVLTADFALGRRLARSGIPLPGLSICLVATRRSAW
jgi:SAM-dependent methyltransferase